MAQANIKAVITAEDRASATLGTFGNNVDAVGSKITGALKVAGVAAFAAVATGIIAATKASWDQVDAVQQATVGLRAYEKDGSKVNQVLSDLVKYARSDLGVLFNRKDLFDSAQSLKLMGDHTGDLVKHVEILSRSVGLGLSNWDELNLIVGRVGSTGRLTGDDFDNLTKAGFKLDTGLRNTNINFSDLFKQLDKGIPADALAGQADTIQGKMIRLDTAFRGVGDAILGVNQETGKFQKGGIGDAIVTMVGNITKALSSPDFKQGIKDTINGIIEGFRIFMGIVGQVMVVLQPFTEYITTNKNAQEVLKYAIIGLGIVLAAIVISMGLTIYWLTLIGVAISDAIVRFINFSNSVYGAMAQFVGSIINGIIQAIGWFGQLPGKIIAAVGNLGGLLYNVGRDIVQGMINGIGSLAGDIGKTLTKASNDAVKKVKDILGIKSPSTVFAGIGENIGQGMIQGIESTAPSVMNAMDSLTPSSQLSNQSSQPSRTIVNQNNPTPNITIQVGAFMGTQTDARKLAKMVFDSYQEIQAMGGIA